MDFKHISQFGIMLIANMLFWQCYAQPSVNTNNIGVIKGETKTLNIKGDEYKVNRYLGIPYAKPPVGELRFAKPEPADKFETPYEATEIRASCPQIEIPFMPLTGEISEDCLFLNIHVPGATPGAASKFPVMVWIHGGGFSLGTSYMFVGDTLSAFGNVIVVTINYRLGLWGFLSTGDEHSPGNYGLWDQHLALRWVHDNIGAFGGDANRVTIFGESAGGASVSLHALYPANKGLFQRVIAESGTAVMSVLLSPDPKISAIFIAEQLDCSIDSSEAIVSCLRNKDLESILTILKEAGIDPEKTQKLTFMPTIDGEFIKIAPTRIARNDLDFEETVSFLRSLDLINGVNILEGAIGLLSLDGPNIPENISISREDMNNKHVAFLSFMALGIFNVPSAISDMIISEYTNWKNPDDPVLLRDQFIKLMGDVVFNVPFIEFSTLHANSSTEVNSYAYQFRPKPSHTILPTPDFVKGATHGDEVGFVFGFDEGMIDALTMTNHTFPTPLQWEYDLAYTVMTYWTNFAKTGNPNKPSPVPVEWSKFTLEKQHQLALDKESSMKQFLYAREGNFWLKTIPSVLDALTHAHDESSTFKQHSEKSCEADGKCGGGE